jgi:hypothetical protein
MPRRRVELATAAALALVASLACSDGGTGPSGRCTSDVEISVVTDLTPYFTWSPSCGVAALFVENVDGGDAWHIVATSPGGIASGVRYGEVPSNADEELEPEPLLADDTYFVIVTRGEGDDQELAGLRSFAP